MKVTVCTDCGQEIHPDEEHMCPDAGVVISFATGKPVEADGGPTEERQLRPCYRCDQSWIVYTDTRELKCRHCGRDVDWVDALRAIVRDFDRVRNARKEHKALREHIEKLHAEEKRTKARTRNASRKDANAAVAAERERWAEERKLFDSWAKDIELAAKRMRRRLRAAHVGRDPRLYPIMWAISRALYGRVGALSDLTDTQRKDAVNAARAALREFDSLSEVGSLEPGVSDA